MQFVLNALQKLKLAIGWCDVVDGEVDIMFVGGLIGSTKLCY